MKSAFDASSILEGARNVLENPLVHSAGLFALGHVAGNAATLIKDKIPGASNAMARAGAHMGVHGKALNPALKSIVTNALGPEFLARDFNPANAMALRAHGETGGVPEKALARLREYVSADDQAVVSSKFSPMHKVKERLRDLPDSLAHRAPRKIMSVSPDSRHTAALEAAGHAASIGAMAAVDPAAPLSAAWNRFKLKAFSSPAVREKVRGIPGLRRILDPSAVAAKDVADGIEKGKRHPLLRAARQVLLSPESEAFRSMGAEAAKEMPPQILRGIAEHLRTPQGTIDMDAGMVAMRKQMRGEDAGGSLRQHVMRRAAGIHFSPGAASVPADFAHLAGHVDEALKERLLSQIQPRSK